MRLAADDVTRSLRGSWHLMTRGADALDELDLSREGFWNSFAAFVLMLPALIATLAAERILWDLHNANGLFDQPLLVAAVIGVKCLAIIAVPVLLVALAPQPMATLRFTSFVIAWNWAGVVSPYLFAVPATVFAIGWATPEIAALQTLAFGAIVLRLRYCVASATFGSQNGAALLTVTASVLADYALMRMFGL